jgi:tetratricopeptide (TPR) repeat protein
MNRFSMRVLLLVFPTLLASHAWAQSSTPAAHLKEAKSREAAAAKIAPIVNQQLFGAIPVSTRSDEARKFVEFSLDKYENHIVEGALTGARRAIEKDPQFALGYAALSLASLGSIPDSAALAHAKALAPRATPDEQLLVRWMTSIGDRDLLPAISASNDLIKRYPRNPHVLYIVADWLYYQQDFDRARKMLENIHQIDPNFAPALNLLSYAYIQTGTPDPKRALESAKNYAELLPNIQNPQDTWGEISRLIGDDDGALEHYSASLKIDPNYVSSRWGLGDTATLMGNYKRARLEYDQAVAVATNPRDRNHAQFQKALVYFWEGQLEQGRRELAALHEKANQQKEPYSQFEIGFGRAMLAASATSELEQLRSLEAWLQKPMDGFSDADRIGSLAMAFREHARVAVSAGASPQASEAVHQLEQLASQSSDPLVENCFETAKGYFLAAQGDYFKASEELAADPRSVLAVSQLIAVDQKLGDLSAVNTLRAGIKYLRTPTVEWYLFSHSPEAD